MVREKKPTLNADMIPEGLAEMLQKPAEILEEEQHQEEEKEAVKELDKLEKTVKEREKAKRYRPTAEDVKKNPFLLEVKSKTILLKTYPTLYEALKTQADKEGVNVTTLIHELIIKGLKKKGAL